jgi:transposase
MSRRLAAIPGVGPITAITMALSVNPAHFESGRHFAAWLGLTPREHSTGGKHRLGRISKAGNERLRQLLVVGATAVIRVAKPGRRSATAWRQCQEFRVWAAVEHQAARALTKRSPKMTAN